jgi:DNA-binding transcriptional regulator YiaG
MVFPDQARANDQKYSDAKREHDGLWTSARISEWRLRWGLSQQQAAQLLGGGANAFSKYERGEVIQSKPMDLLMRMYNEFPGVRESLASLAGSPSQRGWQTDKATPTLKAVLVHSTVLPKDVQRIQSTVDAYKPVREACEELAWEDSVAYGS